MTKANFGLKNTVLHIGADDEGHPTSTKVEFVVKNHKDKGIDASAKDFYLEWFLDEDHAKLADVVADFTVDSYDKETGHGTGRISTIPFTGENYNEFSKPGTYYIVLRSWAAEIHDLFGKIEFVKLKRVEEYKLKSWPVNVKYNGDLTFSISHSNGKPIEGDIKEQFRIGLGLTRHKSLEDPIWFNATSKILSKDKKNVFLSKGSLNSSKKEVFTEAYTGEVYARLFVSGKPGDDGKAKFLPTEEVVVINVRKEQDLFDVTKSSFSITGPKTIYIEPDPIN